MVSAKDHRIRRELDEISNVGREQLLRQWKATYNRDAPRQLSTNIMRKMLAYELQAGALGSLSARATRKLRSTAAESQRKRFSKGVRLAREWKGIVHEVEVIEDGYLWHDHQYRSLSAVALAITGTKWSGPKFFGVKNSEWRKP